MTRGLALAAVIVVVAVAGLLIAVPFGVRALAIWRVEALTGRPATIADVDLNVGEDDGRMDFNLEPTS